MRPDRRCTTRPFTLAVCVECDAVSAESLMPKLLQVVRDCPHAVLISAQCFMGTFTCAATRSARGAMLLLQPCTVDRVPTAAVQLVGPVETEEDAEATCQWISSGVWDPALLPLNLRARMNTAKASQLN